MASRFLLETLPQNKTQMVPTVSRHDGEASERPIEVTPLWQPGCKARRALATKKLLVLANFFFQYLMYFTETACLCALLLRIRKGWHKKRHWVRPVVSKRLLNGQFYKLYDDLRKCRGKFFNYFRMSIESFDKLLVLVGPWITYENTRLRLSVKIN